ncbi:hypothetical protein L1049_012036 [Liquidambar formosana]|uniref:Uncharacterized protein n=1 Tax=Liquidambar formosana TaxID=63359 RepID=A0AAP0RTH9_LIQFO
MLLVNMFLSCPFFILNFFFSTPLLLSSSLKGYHYVGKENILELSKLNAFLPSLHHEITQISLLPTCDVNFSLISSFYEENDKIAPRNLYAISVWYDKILRVWPASSFYSGVLNELTHVVIAHVGSG